MSKFLLDLLVQIFKVYQKSKIQIKFKKVLLLELGPAPVFGLAVAHFLFPSPTGRSPSLHWASASRPAQLALSAQPTTRRWRPARLPPPSRGHASPHDRLRPSSCPADRWAPPVITFLRLRLSSTPRRRLAEPPWLPRPPPRPLSLWPTITTP
jgi:hypothetical protein